VDKLYKGLEHRGVSINVSIRAFKVFKTEGEFPHILASLDETEKKQPWKMDVDNYLTDVSEWDIDVGSKDLPSYDQVILFT
ncbi:hypothetical protein ACJMK2_001298, partial [Sinanodonta woodiana]